MEKDFETENAVILGVSKDSQGSHKRFIEKKELIIKLLSDGQAENILSELESFKENKI